MTENPADRIAAAKERGAKSLSEHDSKQILAAYGIPVSRERLVRTRDKALAAAEAIGYPVVLKACDEAVAHKTEAGLIALDLRNADALAEAFDALAATAPEGAAFLVQEMVKGARELVIGMVRDAQFGPSVMFGLGGIFTEILSDVTFRLAPLTPADAEAMLGEIKAARILDSVRGMPAADRAALAKCLVALGEIAMIHEDIREIDVNPLILRDGAPVAVDALVVLNS